MIYDPDKVMISIGTLVLTNWESATADYEEDQASQDAGVDGESTLIVNNNKNAVAEITLKQTSKQLSTIRGLLNAHIQIPFAILNKGDGGEAVAGPSCMVAKAPITLGKDLSSNVVKIIGKMLIA